MYRIISAIGFFLVCAFSVPAQQMKLFDKLLYVNKGDTLPYRLLKPVSPESKELFPLIIFLHGAGERGKDNESHIQHISDFVTDPKHRGKYPCFVLAPQCPKKQMWADFDGSGANVSLSEHPTKPMQLLIELLARITKEFPVDESRIYVTGLSMGGYGTWDIIARFPEKFAAAVPICGGGAPETAGRIKHIPIWAFHGALDRVVVPRESRKMIMALQQAGATPGYTEYPDIEHNSWVHAYRDPHLVHWLFKQKLGTTTSDAK